MFTVQAGLSWRSKDIRERKLGIRMEMNRGLTRTVFNPEEYFVVGGALPHDGEISFVRVEEQNPAGTFLSPGPILVMPPPGFFSTPRPSLTLSGTAPSVTVPATGLPPADAMHIVLPRFCDNIRLQNLSTTDPLLVSFGLGMPLVSIAPETSEIFYDAAFNDLIGAAVAFDARCAIVNGEMA